MTPRDLRHASPARGSVDSFTFDLAYRPPYDWPAMLAFLERRAIGGVEAVDANAYHRTLRFERKGKVLAGWITVAPSRRRAALRVSVSASLAGALPGVLARVKQLFDLSCHPDEIATALGALAEKNPGLRLPGAVDGFEIAVRAILGQQVTVKGAATLARRFVDELGDVVEERAGHKMFETPDARLNRLFPLPAAVAACEPARIAKLGIIPARATAIVALAREVVAGRLSLEPSADVHETMAALERLPGIGPWTAQYIAMRALSWPDAFPHPDVAVLKAMKETNPRAALASAERWRPWRAYAVMHLWRTLA